MGNQQDIQQNNAFKGQKPFYFVLSNSSLGNLTLTHAPDGWKDNELKLARHKTYHGVIKSVSTKELTFYKEGKNYLQQAYEAEGVNCITTIAIYRYNYDTMAYALYHTAVIDFTTYTINEIGVTVELASDSFWDKFLTRDTTEVDINGAESVEGYEPAKIGYNTITIPDTNVSNACNFTDISSGFVTALNAALNHMIPCTEGTSDFNETQSQTLKENTNSEDDAFFKQSQMARIVNVAGSVHFSYSLGSSWATQADLITLDPDGDVRLTTSIDSSTLESDTFTFDKTLTLYPGESVLLTGTTGSLTDKLEWDSLDFDVTETVVGTVETGTQGYLLYEVFLKTLQRIMDTENPFYSEYFGRTDSALTTYDEDGELIALIKGIYLRNYSQEPIPVKFKEAFDSAFSIYSLSLSHEITPGTSDSNKIRIEELAYAYSNTVVLDISTKLRTENIEKSVYPDLLYSTVDVGYGKFDYEETGGLFEYNTKSSWSTVIRPIKNAFTQISKYRADYNGIKIQINTTDLREDAKGDQDNFLITMDRDGAGFVARQGDDFTYIGGSFYADKGLNLDITPARNLRRLSDFIRGSLMHELNTYLRWQSSDKVSQLETTKSGESMVDEDADIRVNDLTSALWHPEVYKVEVPLTYDEITTVLANPTGLVQIADDKYGWIMNMQTKNWDGMTTFELLRANNDTIVPYPIEGAIRFVKDTEQVITPTEMQITVPAHVIGITIDCGDGVIETVATDSFSHRVADDAVVVIYGAVTEFEMDTSIKISHISAVHHATLTTLVVSDNNNEGADFDRSIALTTIKLNDNSLETIIVTGCTGLTWLRLYDNPTFTENIDVSECTALARYENYNCAQTEIDVSNNLNIWQLDCRNNSLTVLDVTANTKLKTLSARINPLTAIDISQNVLLEWIEARVCDIASFDVSNNPVLVYMQMDYNEVSTADVNSMLADLVAFGETNGTFDFENQSPAAPPTGQGITDAATLVTRGWTVTTD